jgi:hypothetical protein
MEHAVQWPVDVDLVGYVVLDEAEARLILQMRKIRWIAGDEIVHTDDIVAVLEEAIHQMRAKEPSCACN